MEQHSPLSQGLKKRRQLLLVLPLLILPFMTLAFWAWGGGQQQSEGRLGDERAVAGINRVVPRAKTTDGAEDKMTLYAEADRQAAAAKQNRIEDWGRFRYPASMDSVKESGSLTAGPEWDAYGINDDLNKELSDEDPNSLKIRQKLADLQAILERVETIQPSALALPVAGRARPASVGLRADRASGAKVSGQSDSGKEAGLGELRYLKDMIAQSTDVNGRDDTREINAMLDKILAIQRPEKGVERLKAPADVGAEKALSGVSAVTVAEKDRIEVPLLLPAMPVGKTASGQGMFRSSAASADDRNASGFYDIDTKDKKVGNEAESYGNTAVAADIAQTQTLVSGGTVKMRLKTDVIIHGRLMPKGSFVYGACHVNGERLNIDVRHIRLGDQLFSVQLKVFDLDGMEGIHIPGSITRDAAKQGADRGLTGVQMMSLDPSVAAQAATAGMEAAKGLLSKKAKLVRVTVKVGYPILLQNSKGLQ